MPETRHVILLIDDDADFLAITRCLLEKGGCEVVCCHDGEAAMAELDRRPIDLVITDLMMASLDAGFSLAQRIRQDSRFKHLPIILATSASSTSGFDFHPRSPEDLSAMCVDAYFDKPLQGKTLLEKIQQLLGNPSQGTSS